MVYIGESENTELFHIKKKRSTLFHTASCRSLLYGFLVLKLGTWVIVENYVSIHIALKLLSASLKSELLMKHNFASQLG